MNAIAAEKSVKSKPLRRGLATLANVTDERPDGHVYATRVSEDERQKWPEMGQAAERVRLRAHADPNLQTSQSVFAAGLNGARRITGLATCIRKRIWQNSAAAEEARADALFDGSDHVQR